MLSWDLRLRKKISRNLISRYGRTNSVIRVNYIFCRTGDLTNAPVPPSKVLEASVKGEPGETICTRYLGVV